MVRQGARWDEVLDAVTDWVLTHGLTGLSLRPLAADLGTSDRMLLYYAGSKDALLDAVVQRASDRLAGEIGGAAAAGADPPAALRTMWERLSGAEAAPYLRLYFEVYALAMQQPQRWSPHLVRVAAAWRELVAGLLPPTADAERDATALVAVVEGLLLDLLVTGDRERVDAAADAALRRLLG